MTASSKTNPQRIVEVAMEIALPPDFLEKLHQRFGSRVTRDAAMSTSVGGIGPLLRERIVAQGDAGLEVIGVTLLYDTTWLQSWFEWGQLHLEKREVGSALRELLKDTGITLSLPFYDGRTQNVRVWQLAYGKSVVYFLDCPAISQVVYPSEEDAPPGTPQPAAWGDQIRQAQSWLVGRGALALLKALNLPPDIIILSETPTLFGFHRIAQDAFQHDPFFQNTRYIFNDHTPMEYAHPVWSQDACRRVKLDTTPYVFPNTAAQTRGDIDITRLLISEVQGVFGVAEKHGRVMRAMPSLKDYASKIQSITNGIYVPFWQSPEYQKAAAMNDADLLALRDRKKNELLDWVWRTYGLWHTWKDQIRGKSVVLWTRRITGYKRLDILALICKDPNLKRQFMDSETVLLIGGRIHQHDDQAQGMIYNLLDALSQDKALQDRILFLDNFNVWMAPKLFQGADAAVMLADDGREASATGFMKAQVNGGLIIATDDGAIPESVIFAGKEKSGQAANGFEVPYLNGHPTAEGFLNALKQLRQTLLNPAQRAAMFRSAFQAEHQVSLQRTVEQTMAFYHDLPELQATPEISPSPL